MAKTPPAFPPPSQAIHQIVGTALAEDRSGGDITSNILIEDSWQARARIIAKHPMVVAGVLVAQETFRQVDPTLRVTIHKKDGQWTAKAVTIMTISGPARSLLQGERVALNFLQRLSGISTLTHRCCQAIKGLPTILTDTRKTTPGLRVLEKWAVRLGGGHNHRSSLDDGVLIKDNHLVLLKANRIGITQACLSAKARAPHGLKIGVEVENLKQVDQALLGKADVILLDNMTPAQVQQAIAKVRQRAITEVSGGITLDNLHSMARARPDFISIGALTHSAPAMDYTMEITPFPPKRRAATIKRGTTR